MIQAGSPRWHALDVADRQHFGEAGSDAAGDPARHGAQPPRRIVGQDHHLGSDTDRAQARRQRPRLAPPHDAMNRLLRVLDHVERAPGRLEQRAVQRHVGRDQELAERLEQRGSGLARHLGRRHHHRHDVGVRVRLQGREHVGARLSALDQLLQRLFPVLALHEVVELKVNDAVHGQRPPESPTFVSG